MDTTENASAEAKTEAEELIYNNGIYLSRDGKAYLDPEGKNEIEYFTVNGYRVIPNNLLIRPNGGGMSGQWLHRMIVWSFGDVNGKGKHMQGYSGYEIDHIDMDHFNNSVNNLQLVPKIINLWRAADRTNSPACVERFEKEYSKMSPVMQELAKEQIKLDMEGKLK